MSYDEQEGACPCGSIVDVTLAPDPFMWDIHDDDTPVWLCAECRYERAMDV